KFIATGFIRNIRDPMPVRRKCGRRLESLAFGKDARIAVLQGQYSDVADSAAIYKGQFLSIGRPGTWNTVPAKLARREFFRGASSIGGLPEKTVPLALKRDSLAIGCPNRVDVTRPIECQSAQGVPRNVVNPDLTVAFLDSGGNSLSVGRNPRECVIVGLSGKRLLRTIAVHPDQIQWDRAASAAIGQHASIRSGKSCCAAERVKIYALRDGNCVAL